MKLVTGKQMAAIDRYAIQKMGVPGLDLMECAGQAVFERVQHVEPLRRMLEAPKKITVICGKGNNGGDGFVVARLLEARDIPVSVFLVGERKALKGDARTNSERAAGKGIPIYEVLKEEDLKRLTDELASSDGIVDALFGTGIQGAVRGLAAGVIERINASACPVVAVDIPSGVDADTGNVAGPCVRARHTVTFGLPKMGHAFYPGKAYRGALEIADIGFPPKAVETIESNLEWITKGEVAAILPCRAPDAHKGTCGHVLVIAGSVGLTGAAALAGEAALRTGSGLVTLGVPESLNDILEGKLTEVMTRPLPEVRKPRCLSLRAVGDIRRLMERADCVAIGPGLGTHRETVELVGRIVQAATIPLIVDADGLNALSKNPTPLKTTAADVVITPHPGELSRLTGQSIADIRGDPIRAAREAAAEFGATVVLKGAPAVIATKAGRVYVNATGNAGMATGGSGDVLTGIIVGLIGQGLTPEEAAWSGVFLHGSVGDLARDQKGEPGMIAGDIVACIPEALRKIQ
jgi:NAD(P)H-hydrate epimerase